MVSVLVAGEIAVLAPAALLLDGSWDDDRPSTDAIPPNEDTASTLIDDATAPDDLATKRGAEQNA